jgi:hypothetical protein
MNCFALRFLAINLEIDLSMLRRGQDNGDLFGCFDDDRLYPDDILELNETAFTPDSARMFNGSPDKLQMRAAAGGLCP